MIIPSADSSQTKITQSKITHTDKWDASGLWSPACVSALIELYRQIGVCSVAIPLNGIELLRRTFKARVKVIFYFNKSSVCHTMTLCTLYIFTTYIAKEHQLTHRWQIPFSIGYKQICTKSPGQYSTLQTETQKQKLCHIEKTQYYDFYVFVVCRMVLCCLCNNF